MLARGSRQQRRLRAGWHREFGYHIAGMRGDGAGADEQRLGDLGVGRAPAQEDRKFN
jgi:hypothetical protein